VTVNPAISDRAIDRLAMISLHTSPLDQPGTGDAGGMNVYVIELARRLAAQGIEVDIFTRATSSALPPVVEAADGVSVRHIHAGPFEGLTKGELPGQLCVFAREVLRSEAAQPVGHYDVVHTHYWLSGQVGALARDRWGVPLVHSMHTMAKVKNDALATGDTPEPAARIIGEEQVVEAADMLIANTDIEAKQLINLYDADPGRVEVVHPGVDLSVFKPIDEREARTGLGLPADAHVLMFAGRIQPLKAPDVLLRAVAVLLEETPSLRSRLVVPVVGGPSGTGLEHPESLAQLAAELGIDDVVRFVPPVAQPELARWCAAATLVAVPSYNESFGLVAAEAQATGTPVIGAAVGGLTTVIRDGRSGLLVDGHEPRDWANAMRRVLDDDDLRARLEAGAVEQARLFSWERTAQRTLDVYGRARSALLDAAS
jgi:D-inositol-3-phosphate glycosyltransferase